MINAHKKASEIIDLFQNHYCRSDGLLGRRGDCINGRLLDTKALIDEIGDYCQYTIQLGKEVNSKKYVLWGINQVIENINKFQNEDGLIYHNGDKKNTYFNFFSTIRIGDTFWGLEETFRLTKDNKIKKAYDKLCNVIFSNGLFRDAPSYGIYKFKNKLFSLPIAEPMTSGYIGESLLEMYINTGDEKYFIMAKKILYSWEPKIIENKSLIFLRKIPCENNVLLKWMLDKQFKIRNRPGIYSNILTKGDVFLLFAWLALFRINKDKNIERYLLGWVDYISNTMTTDDKRFYNHYDIQNGNKSSIKLEENHSIIELLIDISVEFNNEKALKIALDCVLSWYAKRSSAGLVANQDEDYWAEIDPFLDLLINIAKIRELSGNSKLNEFFEEGINSLWKNFSVEYGYIHKARLDGSGPINGEIELKYMGLLIKGLIVINAIQNKVSLFSKRNMRLLVTDR